MIEAIDERVTETTTTVTLDPFAFLPGQQSRIVGLGGGDPAQDPHYAFHTAYADCGAGATRFRICFSSLTARRGTLTLRVHAYAGEGDVALAASGEIDLGRLADAGGEAEIVFEAATDTVYAVMGAIYDLTDAAAAALVVEVDRRAGGTDPHTERLETALRSFLAAPPAPRLAHLVRNVRPSFATPVSQMCTAAQFEEADFAAWLGRMQTAPTRHRKQWELVFIAQVLEQYGVLAPGARGLGFGCGVELLPATFASVGCEVLATDLPSEDDRAALWNSTRQHGNSIEALRYPAICPDAMFDANVSFRPVDMTAIPADLTGFDFTWSSCAYEHLGSIEAGLAFFESSVRCLRPGGIAVHTTELNLTSNDDTIADGPTVLFRRRDMEALAERLDRAGHVVSPITFDAGDQPLDAHIDLPPYSVDLHLKVALSRYVTTSFGMIVRAGPR